MDENNNNNDIGKNIWKMWKKMPLILRLKIYGAAAAIFIFFMIIFTIISIIPVNHLFFSDEAAANNYTIDSAFEEFISNPCVDGNERCSDEQKANYAKLKEDQEKFIKKLDKVSNKYNLGKEQKYILLTTIFYGNDENFFYSNKDAQTANFTVSSGAYVLDNDDEAEGEDETLISSIEQYLKTDTLKELSKQFNTYPVYCYYKTTNENGEKVETSEPLTHNGEQFYFGFWESIKNSTTADGFAEAETECKSKEDGRVDNGEKTTNSEASINKYYQYLEESNYLDSKESFQKYFFKPYYKSKNITKPTEDDKKEARKQIIATIQEIVAHKMYLDEKYGLNNSCSTLVGNNTDYWWPLADSESGGFASSESKYTRITSKFGPRSRPCSGCSTYHKGTDIGCPDNTIVIAAKDGVVSRATTISGGGNTVYITHNDGVETLYMHLTRYIVKAGDTVRQGQVIGYSGHTGNVSGPHLHFETRINGNSVDSMNYVDPNNQRPGGASFVANTGGTVNPTLTVNEINENKVSFLGSSPINVIQLANETNDDSTSESTIATNNNVTSVNIEDLKTSAEKRKNLDPISNQELSSYTGTTDIWTNLSESILNAAGVDKNGNKIEGKGVTFHEGGQCQVYVRLVYKEAGLGDIYRDSASNAASQTLVSKSMSMIPVGAAVYGKSDTSNGHVGIYIGNGKVIDNVGHIKISNLSTWAKSFRYIGWGWQAGEDKLASASSTSGVNLTGLGNGNCDYDTVDSVQGSGPEQTVCLTLKKAGFGVNAIAAIMGNIDAESSWNPSNVNEKASSKATGLIQWTGDRKAELLNRYPDSWQDPANQAAFILYELNNTNKDTLNYLQTHQNDDVNKMTEEFCNLYERPGPDHCAARKAKGSKYVSYVQNNCGGASTNGQNTESKDGITYINGVMIVNKTYPLPSNYVPSGTHEKAGATGKCNGCIKNEAWTAYQKLREAGLAAGVPSSQLDIVSGYRSYAYQDYIYNKYVKQKGKVEADRASARPGYSEHQTGLAMDLGDASASYHGTKGAKFIHDNAYKYGFILRYPNGKEANTGYKYESWHIRYVGVELATKLYNNGDWITLEEYFNITSRYSN